MSIHKVLNQTHGKSIKIMQTIRYTESQKQALRDNLLQVRKASLTKKLAKLTNTKYQKQIKRTLQMRLQTANPRSTTRKNTTNQPKRQWPTRSQSNPRTRKSCPVKMRKTNRRPWTTTTLRTPSRTALTMIITTNLTPKQSPTKTQLNLYKTTTLSLNKTPKTLRVERTSITCKIKTCSKTTPREMQCNFRWLRNTLPSKKQCPE